MNDYTDLLKAVGMEVDRAVGKHRAQHSLHEGYGVLKEEVDEFWDEVKKRDPNYLLVRGELIQIAAMALRTIHDVVNPQLAVGVKQL